jgi:lysophospholipase L1-like esterase
MRTFSALLLVVFLQDVPGIKAEPRDARWLKRHEGFVADAKKGGIELLLLGDSITDAWRGQKALWAERFEPLKAANFGISGDCTQHLLWRLQNGELDGIAPKAAMILIGTNNIGWNKQDEASTSAGIAAVVNLIRSKSPSTKILLLAVFPRGATSADPFRAQIKTINAEIAKLDDGGKSVRYLDLGPKFLAEDGSLPKELMPDFLHLSEKGYRIWADAVKEPLAELMK